MDLVLHEGGLAFELAIHRWQSQEDSEVGGTTCDADNYVLFRKSNGFIVHEVDEAFIEFDRVGNVYVIDVWVKIGSRADLETSGFARQAVVP